MKTIKLTDKKGLTNTFEFDEMPSITIDGEVVVFESKKVEFKNGDVIFVSDHDNRSEAVFILKVYNQYEANGICYFCKINIRQELNYNDNISSNWKEKRHATQSEAKRIFDALAKDGKQWNAEKECIDDLKVEPKGGDLVKITLNSSKSVLSRIDTSDRIELSYISRIYDGVNYNSIGHCRLTDILSIEILTPDQFQSEVNYLGFEYDFENDSYSVLKWKPKDNDLYYYFNTTLDVCNIHYLIISSIDFLRFENGNCFRTETECQEKIEQIKAILK